MSISKRSTRKSSQSMPLHLTNLGTLLKRVTKILPRFNKNILNYPKRVMIKFQGGNILSKTKNLELRILFAQSQKRNQHQWRGKETRLFNIFHHRLSKLSRSWTRKRAKHHNSWCKLNKVKKIGKTQWCSRVRPTPYSQQNSKKSITKPYPYRTPQTSHDYWTKSSRRYCHIQTNERYTHWWAKRCHIRAIQTGTIRLGSCWEYMRVGISKVI